MKSQRPSFGLVLLGSPLALLVVVVAIALLLSSSPANLMEQVRSVQTREAIFISLKTTLISLSIVVLCGTALALSLARSKGWLCSTVESITTLPAIMPPAVIGLALLLAFGRQGLIGPKLESMGISIAFTQTAVILAQIFVATPYFVNEAIGAFKAVDPSLVESATLDGAGNWGVARWVILPLSAPLLLTGAILGWSRALGEFGATILFAGNLQGVTQTMPLAIYLGFESDLNEAKALAILLLLVAMAILIVMKFFWRKKSVHLHRV